MKIQDTGFETKILNLLRNKSWDAESRLGIKEFILIPFYIWTPVVWKTLSYARRLTSPATMFIVWS